MTTKHMLHRPDRFLPIIILLLLLSPLIWTGGCTRAEPEVEPADIEVGRGQLAIRALYAVDGEEADDVRYLIETAEGEHVTGPGRRNNFDLDAGRYRITATLDQADKTAEATVRPDERTDLQIVLDAGVLDAVALLSEDGPEAPNARFRVLSTEKDIRGDRETITGPGRRSSFVLPARSYIIEATSDQASVEKEVDVRAGERTETTLDLQAGVLHAQAMEEDGSPVSGALFWSVFSGEKDVRGQRATVAGPATRREFFLPAGEYVLQARAGTREVREPIEIQAGKRLEVEVQLPEPDSEPEDE